MRIAALAFYFIMPILFASSATPSELQINIDGNLTWINFLKGGSWERTNDPGVVDDDGYPIRATDKPIRIGRVQIPQAFQGASNIWILKWPDTRETRVTFENRTRVLESNCKLTGGHQAPFIVEGKGCRTRFSIEYKPDENFSVAFPPGRYSFGGSGELVLVRLSDEEAYDNGEAFLPEYIELMKSVGPKTIRSMTANYFNLAGNWTNEVKWSDRTRPSFLTYYNSRFPEGLWGGAIDGRSHYKITPAARTRLGKWVDGETIQGRVVEASNPITISDAMDNGQGLCRLKVSSSGAIDQGELVWIYGIGGSVVCNGVWPAMVVDATTIDLVGSRFAGSYRSYPLPGVVGIHKLTIIGKDGGTKFIAQNWGAPIGYGGAYPNQPNMNSTFFYDRILDRVIWSPGGINITFPIERVVQLANRLQSNLWFNIPTNADDEYVRSAAEYIKEHLGPELNAYFEYSNEMWNFAFPATHLANNRGLALGFANETAYNSYYSLRSKQIFDQISAVWKSRKKFFSVMAGQAAGVPSESRFDGRELVSGKSALYDLVTNRGSYNSWPNRPIDSTDVVAIAPYVEGANIVSPGKYNKSHSLFAQRVIDLWSSNKKDEAIAEINKDWYYGIKVQQPLKCFDGTTVSIKNHGFWNGMLLGLASNSSEPVCDVLHAGKVYCAVNVTPNSFGLSEINAEGKCSNKAIKMRAKGGIYWIGQIGNLTLATYGAVHYARWEAMVGKYNEFRIRNGSDLLTINGYEGGFEVNFANLEDCKRMSLLPEPALACSIFQEAMRGWLQSDHASAAMKDYLVQFADSSIRRMPSQFYVQGPNPWAVMQADLTKKPYYKLFDGLIDYRRSSRVP